MNTNLRKTLYTLFSIGLFFWLGGTLVRAIIAYDLFLPFQTKIIYKSWYSESQKITTIYLYGISAFYTGIAYSISFISALGLCIAMRNDFRKEAWLLMILVLFLMFSPFEIYSLIMDYQLNLTTYYTKVTDINIQPINDYFLKRFSSQTLRTFSVLSFLANFTIIPYSIFKPLKVK